MAWTLAVDRAVSVKGYAAAAATKEGVWRRTPTISAMHQIEV